MARKWAAQVEVILTNQKVDETRFVRRRGRRLESGDRQKENTLSMVRVVRASANQAFDRVQKVSVTVQNELRVLLA
jgi:hypothetical protein